MSGRLPGWLWTSIKFIAKQILYKGIIKAARRLSADTCSTLQKMATFCFGLSSWAGGYKPKRVAASVSRTADGWLNVEPISVFYLRPLTLPLPWVVENFSFLSYFLFYFFWHFALEKKRRNFCKQSVWRARAAPVHVMFELPAQPAPNAKTQTEAQYLTRTLLSDGLQLQNA